MDKRSSQDQRTRVEHLSDPRAVASRRKIVEAYRDLVASEGAALPAVNRIAARAGVTRSTFYAHFPDAGALAAEAFSELFDAVAALDVAVRFGPSGSPSDASQGSMREIIGFVHEHRDVYTDLFSQSLSFTAAVEDALATRLVPTLRATPGAESDPELTARFVTAGIIGVLRFWLQAGDHRTPDDLTDALMQIIPEDFKRR